VLAVLLIIAAYNPYTP